MKIYYVYRITCHHPDSPERYYYGYRGCVGDPQDDVGYWSSSSTLRAAIATYGPLFFTKKILAVYPTKEAALAHEVRLHARLQVKAHPLFFNRANQTSTRFTVAAFSAETRAKLAAAARGRFVSEETRAKLAAAQRARPPHLRGHQGQDERVPARPSRLARDEGQNRPIREPVLARAPGGGYPARPCPAPSSSDAK